MRTFLICFVVSGFFGPAYSNPSGWIEIAWTPGRSPDYPDLTTSEVYRTPCSSGVQTWGATVAGYFKVTGSTNQQPPWRSKVANLCDNVIPYSESWTDTLVTGVLIISSKHYLAWGTNTFSKDGEMPSRSYEEKVFEDLFWVNEPAGGGGGGS